jgi:hypothetical protein
MTSRPLSVLPLLLLGACANMSTFQTGRTLGEGELRYGAGIEASFVEEFEVLSGADADPMSELDTGFPIPAVMGWVRYGVAENIDMGLRLFTLGIAGEMKAQFMGDRETPFAASAGLTLSYFGLDVPPEEEASTGDVTFGGTLGLLDVAASLHLSYALPDDWLTLYGAPRYISRTVLLGGEVEEGPDRALGLDLWGAAFGLSFGRSIAVFVEAGLYAPIGFDGLMADLAVGVEL